MSHFIVLVFTKENKSSVDELLAPYDEGIVCEPYVKYTKEEAIEKTREDIEEYKNTIYADFIKDPDGYKERNGNSSHIKYLENEFPKKLNWNDEQCYEDMKIWFDEDMIDDNGNLLSTYNPNSKWDWYVVGGRWSGYFGNKCDEDYVSEIKWNKDLIPFAFVTPDGVWHERGNMGWWAMVTNEKEADKWEEEFMKFIECCDDDVIVTAVDCHI